MDRKARMLDFLGENPGSRSEEIRAAIAPDMSRQTIWRDMNEMVRDGIVKAEGKGAATVYVLDGPEAVRRFLAKDPSARPPVQHDGDFIDAYVPGKTFYLDDGTRRKMKEAGMPPDSRPGVQDTRVLERFLLDLSWASSSLEGNTFSMLDTERLIRFGEMPPGKTDEEVAMILNHRNAIAYISSGPDTPAVSGVTLRNIHTLLSRDLLGDPIWEGALRTHIVEIKGSPYRPLDNPHRIADEFDILARKAQVITDPFEQAFFLMVHIPYLQAFEDCSKRTSRVAANIPLLRAGLSPLSLLDVTSKDYVDGILGVYELNDVSLLAQVIADAYVKSADRYWSPQIQVQAPSRVILANRDFIKRAVHDLVKEHGGFDRERVRAMALRDKVGADVMEQVIAHVRKSVEGLHEGNLVRFDLGPRISRDCDGHRKAGRPRTPPTRHSSRRTADSRPDR